MDTRYWGPSAWRLLHLISFAAKSSNLKKVTAFFWTIPYILPCKYCRASFSEYLDVDPVADTVAELPKWLWRMHKRVNAKLRSQGQTIEADPPFSAVEKIYTERLEMGCTKTSFDGWEFLFSVAEGHPLSRAAQASTPIAGHPPTETVADPLEQNRWNILPIEDRWIYYTQFWKLLPDVLPFPEWTASWKRAIHPAVPPCRTKCMKYVWTIRRHMEKDLDLLNRTTYSSLCKEIHSHKSGCSTSTSARQKTCRKKRSRM